MALQEAQIFKNFLIKSDTTQGVFFGIDTPVTVGVKCDNFADTVQVYNPAETIDLFSYKYITFDGSTVFEITDCIQADKYFTLFVTLLSRIKLNTWDSNFLLTHSTHERLSYLGFNFNKWVEILGNTVNFVRELPNNNLSLVWALKIELSAIPDNLGGYRFDDNSPVTTNYDPSLRADGLLSYNPLIPNELNPFYSQFAQTSNSYVVIVPMPLGAHSAFVMQNTTYDKTINVTLSLHDFMRTLDALISDLTLSVEIIPLSNSAPTVAIAQKGGYDSVIPLVMRNVGGVPQYYVKETFNPVPISQPVLWAYGGLAHIAKDRAAANVNYPFFFMEFGINAIGTNIRNYTGFVLIYNYIQINYINVTSNKCPVAINILGNTIELDGKYTTETVWIKFNEHGLRIYINYAMNNFVDIENSMEFAKNSFSNYNAYVKANVEVSQRQERETLKIQQQQAEKEQRINIFKNGINAISNTAKSFVYGGIGAAASTALSVAGDLGFDAITFNQKQQNERANLKLKQAQQMGDLRMTVVPSSVYQGAATLTDVVYIARTDKRYSLSYISVELDAMQKIQLYEYIINNQYMTYRQPYSQPLIMPDYTPAGKPILCMFTASPETNNKSFVALCKPYTG